MTDEVIYSMNESVLNHFGADHQLHKMEEELVELLLIAKRVRSGRSKMSEYMFLEEIADVENVIDQMKIEIQRDMMVIDSKFSIASEINRIKTHKLRKVMAVHSI
jgi:hypothetical protein